MVFKCFNDLIYTTNSNLCPFCNEPIDSNKEYQFGNQIDLLKKDKDEKDKEKSNDQLKIIDTQEAIKSQKIIEEMFKNTNLAISLHEVCIFCNQPFANIFARTKLPNCEHSLHKKCFMKYWSSLILKRYSCEDVNQFEELAINCSCSFCDSEVPFSYITSIIPWSKIIKSICEIMQKEYMSAGEALSKQKTDATMICCSRRYAIIDLRKILYEALKNTCSLNTECKGCNKIAGLPLKKITGSDEYRILSRMICVKCKRAVPIFSALACGHYICRNCFCDNKDSKVQCFICNSRVKIKKLWTSCCKTEIEYPDYESYLNTKFKQPQTIIKCKWCFNPMKMCDMLRSTWIKNPMWKSTCSGCDKIDPTAISLDCGHTLCVDCLFLRCIPNRELMFSCPICYKTVRANLCSCSENTKEKLENISEKVELEQNYDDIECDIMHIDIYCENFECRKMLPPTKFPFFKKYIKDNDKCMICRKNKAFTSLYDCGHFLICAKCIKNSTLTHTTLYFNEILPNCKICNKSLASPFLYAVKQFCIYGKHIIEKITKQKYKIIVHSPRRTLGISSSFAPELHMKKINSVQ